MLLVFLKEIRKSSFFSFCSPRNYLFLVFSSASIYLSYVKQPFYRSPDSKTENEDVHNKIPIHRSLEEIVALISASAWAAAIPDDSADPLWVDLRADLGLTGLEAATYKKYYYKPEITGKRKHNRTYNKQIRYNIIHHFL